MKKKKFEEFTFPIEFGSNIKLTEDLHILSLMNSCPRCSCRMDDLGYYCSYCGYIKFPKYSGIGI